ncbi:cell wall metabolism sensor histidine kinase WalK [Erythrobacter sp. THAF29]|uniref:sensor histidine kinase n=1 Tax=Erythrobacter sp. THAF29 TaxID=2587851 RepID=UPI001268006C|nr:ATP-binding protein [Erythrobacter sp. THAF29]QFT77753.1 Alkaline phosphatase synthesis sensor protein PhoR [Erythrobacter sp. THAF29]
MGVGQNFPLAGILLAIVTFVAMLLLGLDPGLAVAVLVIWVGSLLLAAGRPPDPQRVSTDPGFTPESMSKLIEHGATPILVTQKNTVAVANAAARRMLGRHIIGQDARVAFRQPEAISLISNNRNGRALVRGLVRRRDIWEINRQSLDDKLAVIELINQTAEADISRAHTDFVANASHELRTPLASILGYVETLQESGGDLDTPTATKFLATIEREAKRLHSLISDLMSLSRVEAEKHDLPQEVIALAPLIHTASNDAAGEARSGRLDLSLDPSLHVLGDRQQLEQLVRNLVDNALKYARPDSTVKVMLDTSRDGQARITVADEGEGIAPEQIPHLTRRFYRTDPGRSRASGGTGLGLAIVKHIVQRHRGRLDIESDLGKGTRVIVRIPLADGSDASERDVAITTEKTTAGTMS